MTIWFDVEDLVKYFYYTPRPTGIQRLSFEIYRQLQHVAGTEDIRFCRRGASARQFRSLHFPALEAGILAAAAAGAGSPLQTGAALSLPRPASWTSRVAPRFRQPLGEIARGFGQAAAGLRSLALAGAAQFTGKAARAVQIGGHQFDLGGEDIEFAPGDWLVNLGAAWDLPYDPAFLAGLRQRGIRFALLVYDIIPELFPEWTILGAAADYHYWLRETVPAADVIFTISQYTAHDLTRCIAAYGKTPQAPVVLPVGTAPRAAARPLNPLRRPYVLMVATIEIRKNHLLMFRVWRLLMKTLSAHQMPLLVFAGKTGWLTTDLLHQLENSSWAGGNIMHIPSPSEPELAALYSNCLFTVFPSFYEGWGLPVTESLGYGKPVAASNRSAIPEAGGDGCAYFNPDDLDDAYAVIAGLILHPERIAALQSRIAGRPKPPSWADTAAALLKTLAPHPAEAGEAENIMVAAQFPR